MAHVRTTRTCGVQKRASSPWPNPVPQGRVLLLENDDDVRALLVEVFKEEGFKVIVCASLHDIRAGLARFPDAVVITDSWPGSGHQVLNDAHRAEIRDLARTAPLILTTGRAWAVNAAEGDFGSAILLPKPYDLEALLAAVRAARSQDRPGRQPGGSLQRDLLN